MAHLETVSTTMSSPLPKSAVESTNRAELRDVGIEAVTIALLGMDLDAGT